MSKFVLNLIGGFSLGFGLVFSCDEANYIRLHKFFGNDLLKQRDYLVVPSNIPLEERRKIFAERIQTRGLSYRLLEMIGHANRELFETQATRGKLNRSTEMIILEQKFRDYYPELFDERNGFEFIQSLNLKTKCDDHDVPLLLKPR